MSITLNTVDILRTYLNGVLGRSNHHANNVNSVVLTLIGCVIWKSTGEIEVRENSGNPANILWFYINDSRFAFVYNHITEQIDLKENSMKGRVLTSFNNSSNTEEIKMFFQNLS